jgi:hypothetical protein
MTELPVFSRCVAVFGMCWLISVIGVCAPAVGGEPGASMPDLLDTLSGGGSGAYEAREELRAMPSEEVIGALVAWLQGEQAAHSDLGRQFAYELLFHHRAELSKAGLDQLIRGLADERGCSSGVRALGRVKPEDADRAIAALEPLLLDPNVSIQNDVIRSLTRLRAVSPDIVAQIVRVHQEHVASQNPGLETGLRENAAYAVLSLAGAGRIVSYLSALDPVGTEATLVALARYGAETGGTLGVDKETRRVVRHFVLDSFDAPHKNVRAAALECVMAVYGDDLVVGSQSDGYRINPEVDNAIKSMARSDADPELRESASQMLTAFEPLIRKHERQRDGPRDLENGVLGRARC